MTPESRHRLSVALYAIHKPSFYYAGFTEEGRRHLDAGGEIGPNGMPMGIGMQRHECCGTCHHVPGQRAWPCDTVKLLLEAGVVDPFRYAEHAMDWSGDIDFAGLGPEHSVNIRPDKRPEIRRYG